MTVIFMSKNTEIHTLNLAGADELTIVKTFECGQCFRWNADENGIYTGVAFGYPARVWTENGRVYLRSAAPDELWREYFDLDRDYAAATRSFDGGEYLAQCVEFGRGIRILRQDRWEALCSFIISQCNNITRIKGIVERLCAMFGDELEFEGERFYSFPPAERLAGLQAADLAPLRCGYRAPYIIDAAAAVASAVGVDEYRAGLLPGDKVSEVERLLSEKKRGTLAFAGDGINDAPVLMRADIGIAMGGLGSDAARAAADIVRMNDKPSDISYAVRISRKTMSIVRENIVFALAVKAIILILSALGISGMWAAVFADVGVMVLAVLNAIRALRVHNL